jgi:hypothetical protein
VTRSFVATMVCWSSCCDQRSCFFADSCSVLYISTLKKKTVE